MAYALKPIDDSFFQQAPLVVPATVELAATPERVWEVLGSDRMWSWTPAIDQLQWQTPHGEGAIRRLRIGRFVTLDEEFYRWEPARRATFRVTAQTRRVFDGLAEDFLLEPTATGTRLTWTMAMAPNLPGARLLSPLAGLMKGGNAAAIGGIKKLL